MVKQSGVIGLDVVENMEVSQISKEVISYYKEVEQRIQKGTETKEQYENYLDFVFGNLQSEVM